MSELHDNEEKKDAKGLFGLNGQTKPVIITSGLTGLIIYMLTAFGLIGPQAEARLKENYQQNFDIQAQLIQIQNDISTMKLQIEKGEADRIYRQEIILWRKELGILNPELNVPKD